MHSKYPTCACAYAVYTRNVTICRYIYISVLKIHTELLITPTTQYTILYCKIANLGCCITRMPGCPMFGHRHSWTSYSGPRLRRLDLL